MFFFCVRFIKCKYMYMIVCPFKTYTHTHTHINNAFPLPLYKQWHTKYIMCSYLEDKEIERYFSISYLDWYMVQNLLTALLLLLYQYVFLKKKHYCLFLIFLKLASRRGYYNHALRQVANLFNKEILCVERHVTMYVCLSIPNPFISERIMNI